VNQDLSTTFVSTGAGPVSSRRLANPVLRLPPQPLVSITGAASATAQAPAGPGPDWVLEESFEATIEEIRDDAIRVHTVSSGGEEGDAWLPMARIPDSERRWIALGVPMRVAVLYDRNARTRRRESFVRVLRPSQWLAPVTKPVVEKIADKMLARMHTLLARGQGG
jgi:hypothetical protein